MTFLCDMHREFLQQNPAQAYARWEEWMGKGYGAMDNHQWRQAVAYFGCCYEISDWFLQQDDYHRQQGIFDYSTSVDRLMISGHLLALGFGKLGCTHLERHFLVAVHNHLHSCLPRLFGIENKIKAKLELSLLALEEHCRRFGEFQGYQQCRAETLQVIRYASQQRAQLH
ncbi:MAG: hypothetical protein M0Q95_07320 [Porticoccaceae bacterium]|nr:hypothetical protein [Porticoccaceae bacterium]